MHVAILSTTWVSILPTTHQCYRVRVYPDISQILNTLPHQPSTSGVGFCLFNHKINWLSLLTLKCPWMYQKHWFIIIHSVGYPKEGNAVIACRRLIEPAWKMSEHVVLHFHRSIQIGVDVEEMRNGRELMYNSAGVDHDEVEVFTLSLCSR